MKLPYLLKIRVEEQGKRPIRLWLPLFLLWPLIPLVLLIGLPFVLLAGFALGWTRMGRRRLGALLDLPGLMLHLSGLEILVESSRQKSRVRLEIR